MIKHTQTICRQTSNVFDHCVGLVLKELKLGHFSILCMKGLNKKFLIIWFKKQNIFAAIQCLQINNNNNFDQRIANHRQKKFRLFLIIFVFLSQQKMLRSYFIIDNLEFWKNCQNLRSICFFSGLSKKSCNLG